MVLTNHYIKIATIYILFGSILYDICEFGMLHYDDMMDGKS